MNERHATYASGDPKPTGVPHEPYGFQLELGVKPNPTATSGRDAGVGPNA